MRSAIILVLLLSSLASGRIPILRPIRPSPDAPSTPDSPGSNVPGQQNNPHWQPGQSTPDVPAAQPGRFTEEPQKPACNGKKRMECVADSSKWDQLDPRFRRDGAAEIARLDRIKQNPGDAAPEKLSLDDFNDRYDAWIDDAAKQEFDSTIGHRLLGHNKDDKWTKFTVENRDDKIDELLSRNQVEGKVNGIPISMMKETFRSSLLETYTSIERKSIAIPRSYNNDLDVYRGWTEGMTRRQGLDETQSVRWTDEVMIGWKGAIDKAGKQPQDVELESVLRVGIVTDDTNDVINAALARIGRKLDDNNDSDADFFKFQKNDPDPNTKEGFEAIAGTIHARRVAQMLRDYHDDLGDRTITGFWIRKSSGDIESKYFDMVVKIDKIPDA
ncbi:hypothetical protein BDV95DRAFT_607333 [Massariosphaeria phaeospora]|uniref:Uncharacterized protein n=1 Tax=Massariosphaeria phaeospora TaxID=100035 RepID=A0A7C8M7S0_9PLEO|nr:hypothetical protein BDV95DRAFT_607333 [Massariosphaeria phaeospora]